MDYRSLARLLLRGGDRHSSVYIDGLCAALKLRIENEPAVCNYPQGSLEFDAYFYGCRRGADEFRHALIEALGIRDVALDRFKAMLAGDKRAA